MRRVATFPVLFLLALGCLIAADKVVPDTAVCLGGGGVTTASLMLIALGGALAFCSVALPWFRYVRADGGRIGLGELVIGVCGGLILAGLSTFIVVFLITQRSCGSE